MSETKIVEVLEKSFEQPIDKFVEVLQNRLNHGKIWICGNGGSSSTCSHFASDLMSLGFDVMCMNDNIARITSLANDYSWENVYIKQMVHFKTKDVLIVISVHGGRNPKTGKAWSSNLTKACEYVKKINGCILALLGGDGGVIKNYADYSIIVPNEKAWIVESIHACLFHLICHKLNELDKNLSDINTEIVPGELNFGEAIQPKHPKLFSTNPCQYCGSETVKLDPTGVCAPYCVTCRKVQ